MSSLPGHQLEDYVMWLLNIKVVGQDDANPSLQIAETIGTATTNRPVLTQDQFNKVLHLFERYRDLVEYRLSDFDEETQSWRDYAMFCFDFIPQDVIKTAHNLIEEAHEN